METKTSKAATAAKTDKKSNGATAETNKNDTSKKKRERKDFKDMNEREKVVAIVMKAKSLAVKNDLKGLEGMTNAKDSKALASQMNPVTKPGGRIETCEDGQFKELKVLAKSALLDLKEGKYEQPVKDLLDFCINKLKGQSNGGAFNKDSVKDWSI